MKNIYKYIIAFVSGCVLGIIVYTLLIKPVEQKAFQEAKNKQDSLIIVRDAIIKNVIKYSNQNAAKGSQLIKTLPNEKIIIPDTTTNAKWEYLQNYSPNKVLP